MRGFLAGWGVRIAIIAVIAAGAFLLRDRLSGNAGDLAVEYTHGWIRTAELVVLALLWIASLWITRKPGSA